jgi:HD-like signal output (HDOD) protein
MVLRQTVRHRQLRPDASSLPDKNTHKQEHLNVASPNIGPSIPGTVLPDSADETVHVARDRLLQRLIETGNLPALGSSVTRVVQLASSDGEAVHHLAHFILSDVALTQAILRISNTVYYRAASGTPVTTVSKAILLLGFDTIKTCALAMLLVEGMSGQHAQSVRNELGHALAASIIGRELARRSPFKDPEEAAVAALFKNIGRVLIAAYEHRLYSRINRLVEGGSHTSAQASMEVLGCGFDFLGKSVLQEWNIPDTIIQALLPLPVGVLKLPKGRQEWLQQVAAFSASAAALIPHLGEPELDVALNALLKRFGTALNLDREKLMQLLATATQETLVLADNAMLATEDVPAYPSAAAAPPAASAAGRGLPGELLLDCMQEAAPMQISARHSSGKPLNARDLLLAGVQDVTQILADGDCKVNDVLLLALETLYSGLGFRFATICLRDMQTAQFRARMAIGENNVARRAKFVFQAGSGDDLFHLALEKNADLMIADAGTPKVSELLPAWHRALLPDARSFIILPLVVNNQQIGLFYADRSRPAPEGMLQDEAALIKTLKGQVLAAMNKRLPISATSLRP